jgi:S-ribosylhomocysteine lyase
MDTTTMHSVEHMMATYLRNGPIGQDVLYFGPMGCQTGFYFLVKDRDPNEAYAAIKDALKKTIDHAGPIFGASRKECGNYEDLSLVRAQKECEKYLRLLEESEPHTFEYRSEEASGAAAKNRKERGQ